MLETIARAQISAFDPDVVFIHNMHSMSPRGLDRLRAEGRYLVSQMASILPGPEVYRRYDLLLSSFHHFVRRFREEGLDSEYFPLAFYERVLSRLAARGVSAEPGRERPIGLSFIGGIDPTVHSAGTALLERVSQRLPLEVWGYGADALPPGSPLLERFRGPVWGLDMYTVLASSRITINRHIDAAEGQANNMRLFEATGMGTALLTESAWNLEELFEPGPEVVAYEDEDDLVEKANRLLAADDERLGVATAGQRRTLSQHTYRARMAELSAMLAERVPRPVAAA
jgi:spore maturation protein CgeB